MQTYKNKLKLFKKWSIFFFLHWFLRFFLCFFFFFLLFFLAFFFYHLPELKQKIWPEMQTLLDRRLANFKVKMLFFSFFFFFYQLYTGKWRSRTLGQVCQVRPGARKQRRYQWSGDQNDKRPGFLARSERRKQWTPDDTSKTRFLPASERKKKRPR